MPIAQPRDPLARRARRAAARTVGASKMAYGAPTPAAPMDPYSGVRTAAAGGAGTMSMGSGYQPGGGLPAGRVGPPAGGAYGRLAVRGGRNGPPGRGGHPRGVQPGTPSPWDAPESHRDDMDTWLNRYNRYATDPLERIKGMAGYDNLTNENGNPALYRALADQGIANVGSAGRRARTMAQARGGMGQGLSYASLAGNAERDAYSGLNDAMLNARSDSVGANSDFMRGLISDQNDYLQRLNLSREGQLGGASEGIRNREQQDRNNRKRHPISIGFGGSSVSF